MQNNIGEMADLSIKEASKYLSHHEKRIRYLKEVVHLCYNRLYLKKF